MPWPSNTAALNPVHAAQNLVPAVPSYGSPGFGYSPSVVLPTPSSGLLPPLSVPAGLSPNFNFNLNVSSRLLASTQLTHPLSSFINSLQGLNKNPATSHQSIDAKAKCENDAKTDELKARFTDSSESNRSPSREMPSAMDDSKSEASSPTTSTSPASSPLNDTVASSVPSTNNNPTKTVWRPY